MMEAKKTKIAKQEHIGTPRRISVGPAQKGLMHKFIRARAKSVTDCNNNVNEKGSPIKPDCLVLKKGSPIETSDDIAVHYHQSIYSPKPFKSSGSVGPKIERDENGKPIRRGFMPAYEKIQMELKDFKHRESELRQSRRCYSLSPHLLASVTRNSDDDTVLNSDNISTKMLLLLASDKVKSSRSCISSTCSDLDSEISDMTSLNSSFDYRQIHQLPQRKSLPATFKMQDIEEPDVFESEESEEEEQLSSKTLIAKWENIIRENAKK